MTVSYLVATLAQLFIFIIIIRAVLSWFPTPRTLAPVTNMLNDATDPILRPIQRRLPPLGGFDLSPLIAILLISAVESLVLALLAGH